jgi:hypothetical protein
MVDVLLSNESISVFGGPASIDINVDFGAPGIRGSLIFTGPGKPTDPTVNFPTEPRPQDLYINLLPSDFEYLFLYQYGSINGVLSWSKVLRLIPNTAIANIPVIFLDGIARTLTPTPEGLDYIATLPSGPISDTIDSIIQNAIVSPTAPSPAVNGMLWLDISNLEPIDLKVYIAAVSTWVKIATVSEGLFFPISDYFSSEEILVGEASGFNIQYVLLSESPTSSGLTTGDLTEIGSKVYLPVNITATETEPFTPGGDVAWQKINGVKILSFVVVANIGSLPLF